MRLLVISLFSLILALFYGIYLSSQDFSVLPKEDRLQNRAPYADFRGVLNVRTKQSDGLMTEREILELAQSLDIDFVITSDPFRRDLAPWPSGYHDRVLLLSGVEYSYLGARFLVVGLNTQLGLDYHLRLADWLSEPNREGRDEWIVMLSPLSPMGEAYWKGEWPVGLDAVEVLNPKVLSERVFHLQPFSVLTSLFIYPFNPSYAFLRIYQDPKPELRYWQNRWRYQRLVGVCGLDLSARAVLAPGVSIAFPSYETIMQLMSIHVLSKTDWAGFFEKDYSTLMSALKEGQVYWALDMLGDPRGFWAHIRRGEKKWLMGSELLFQDDLKLQYSLGREPWRLYEVELWRDEQLVERVSSYQGEVRLSSPGASYLTVRVGPKFPFPDQQQWVTWIVSNPFYVREWSHSSPAKR